MLESFPSMPANPAAAVVFAILPEGF